MLAGVWNLNIIFPTLSSICQSFSVLSSEHINLFHWNPCHKLWNILNPGSPGMERPTFNILSWVPVYMILFLHLYHRSDCLHGTWHCEKTKHVSNIRYILQSSWKYYNCLSQKWATSCQTTQIQGWCREFWEIYVCCWRTRVSAELFCVSGCSVWVC